MLDTLFSWCRLISSFFSRCLRMTSQLTSQPLRTSTARPRPWYRTVNQRLRRCFNPNSTMSTRDTRRSVTCCLVSSFSFLISSSLFVYLYISLTIPFLGYPHPLSTFLLLFLQCTFLLLSLPSLSCSSLAILLFSPLLLSLSSFSLCFSLLVQSHFLSFSFLLSKYLVKGLRHWIWMWTIKVKEFSFLLFLNAFAYISYSDM